MRILLEKSKVIIIGIMVAFLIDFFILPLLHTSLRVVFDNNFEQPISHYLFYGNLSLIVSGIYIGLIKANDKVLIGAIVGLLYMPFWRIVAIIILNKDFEAINYLSAILTIMKNGFLCALFSWSTSKFAKKVLKMGSGHAK